MFHKPYGVLSQFTGDGARSTLADFGLPAGIYAAGRLDADSEGLLLLTDDGPLIHKLLHPQFGHPRTYWAQVEGSPDTQRLQWLQRGVLLSDGPTRPCTVQVLEAAPEVCERIPPIRFRKTVPTHWLELTLTEGRNRQVRRMTAAVGLPTLRLIRVRLGDATLGTMKPGEWRDAARSEVGGGL